MHVFISYPHEFEVFAVLLEAELANRPIKTFLDKEVIKPGNKWLQVIEKNIVSADVFVILYLADADKKERGFHGEIEKIERECRNSPHKSLITVIFSSNIPGKVPPYFSAHQLIITDVPGDIEHKRNAYWVDQVVQQIVSVKEGKNLKIRRIIARTALAAGIIVVGFLYTHLHDVEHKLREKTQQITEFKQKLAQLTHVVEDGEAVCKRLIGDYALHHPYVFVVGSDARSVAKKGTWTANGCHYSKEHDAYILQGKEVTDFDVEMNINSKYERIATATYHYKSKVFVSKNGTLLGRNFTAVLIPQNTEWFDKNANGDSLKISRETAQIKFNQVTTLRNDLHEKLKTSPCIPAVGTSNGLPMVAFVCQHYTRVMVQTSSPFTEQVHNVYGNNLENSISSVPLVSHGG